MDRTTIMSLPVHEAYGAVRHDYFFRTDREAFNSIIELSDFAKKQGVKAMLDREYPDIGSKNIIVNIIDGNPYVIDGNRHCVSLLMADPYITFGDLEALCPGILRIWHAGVEEGKNSAENPYEVYIPIDVDISSVPGAHRGIDYFKDPPAPTNIVPGSFPPDSELLPEDDRGCRLSDTVSRLQRMIRFGEAPRELPEQKPVEYPVEGGNIYIDTRRGLVVECDKSVTKAVIPERIGDFDIIGIHFFAFSNCAQLESVTVPDSVVHIGKSAFYGCVGLKDVSLSGNVVNGGWEIFSHCDGLEHIELPQGMKEVYPMMFMFCKNLKSVYIPDSVSFIAFNAFTFCEKLETVRLPAGVDISNQAFSDCGSLKKVYFEGTRSCWDSLNMGYGNDALRSAEVIIEGEMQKAANVAASSEPEFEYCQGSGGYGSASPNLPWLTAGGTIYIDSVKGQLLDSDQDFSGSLNMSSIPCGTHICGIGQDAFNRRTGLSDIHFSDSVSFIGNAAFYGCDGLSFVTMPPRLEILGDDAFGNCSRLLSVIFPGGRNKEVTIGGGAFARCEKLTSVTFLGNVNSIGGGAFYDCKMLMSITFGGSLKSIGAHAFSGCDSLVSITLPDDIQRIEESAFDRCGNLCLVHFMGSREQWERVSVAPGNEILKNAEICFLN
ncbi:MAG: leucine-rich repeat domain-containing protein [Ruminococcaceae bacterium]|nr:leucine-rich repeat domain-containing protein [Oscillospiraceae bacterium]